MELKQNYIFNNSFRLKPKNKDIYTVLALFIKSLLVDKSCYTNNISSITFFFF